MTVGLVGGRSDSPNLEFRPFATDEMVIVVPAKHPWKKRKQVTLEELAEQPLILREPGSGSRWCLEHALAQVGKSPHDLNTVMELGSNEAIKEAVLRGVGAAILSTYAIHKERQAGLLHTLTLANMPLPRDLFIVLDRRRVLPIPARVFLDYVATAEIAQCGG